MARTQISIKLNDELLARIDRFAEDSGVTRTAIIEKALENDLPEQEAFARSLENPVIRAVHERITSPRVLRLLATLASADVSDAELERIIERAPEQREAAKRRVAKKKPRGRGQVEGA